MAGKRTRQPIEAQFRAEALRLVREHPERQKSSIARDLGIDAKTLYAWIQADKKSKSSQPDALEASAEENARLRRELKVVTQERDILKNAIGIFSQRPR